MGQPEYSRLTEDEEQSAQYGSSLHRPSRSRCSRSPLLYVIDLILALAVAFLLFRRHTYERAQQFDLNSDITGYAPQIDHRLVTFTKQPYFISNHSSLESLREAREHWKTLVPRECVSAALLRVLAMRQEAIQLTVREQLARALWRWTRSSQRTAQCQRRSRGMMGRGTDPSTERRLYTRSIACTR